MPLFDVGKNCAKRSLFITRRDSGPVHGGLMRTSKSATDLDHDRNGESETASSRSYPLRDASKRTRPEGRKPPGILLLIP